MTTVKAVTTVRFDVERLYSTSLDGSEGWTRESIAGARSLTAAKRDLREIKRWGASWQRYRIVRVTTTTKKEICR